ncbi:MAG: hypothetical protein KAT34_05865 [Candidatus Aminicenantes bacterium]|jgi:hypothetical protein|nr:hypothetical protein [Candidatus Aminicenantes bacterium]
MAKKVKLTKEGSEKADEIIAFHGYSSVDELVENLINNEYEKIKSDDNDDNKDEQAERLSGLGYIS